MEDDLNFLKMEDDLDLFDNGLFQRKDDLKKIIQPKTIKIKTMVLATLRVT